MAMGDRSGVDQDMTEVKEDDEDAEQVEMIPTLTR
jgi:hypothetical protein